MNEVEEFEKYIRKRVAPSSSIQYMSQYNVFKQNYSFDKTKEDNIIDFVLENKKLCIIRRSVIKHYLYFKNDKETYLKVKEQLGLLKQSSREVLTKHLTFNQIKLLVDTLESPYKLIIKILYETGCRTSALLNAQKTNVVLDDNNDILMTVKEKRGYIRTFYLTEETGKALLDFANKPDNIIFKDYDYKKVWRFVKIKCIELFGKDIGENVSMHWFRGSRAMHVFKKTKDIRKAKAILGHKRTETTEIYLRESGIDIKQILKENKPKW